MLKAKGSSLVAASAPTHFIEDTPTATLVRQVLGAIAEFEHALISERTRDGLAAARARGRTGGQKPKLGPRQASLARQMYHERDGDGRRRYTVAQIAAEFGVTRPTIYRHLAKLPAAGQLVRGRLHPTRIKQ